MARTWNTYVVPGVRPSIVIDREFVNMPAVCQGAGVHLTNSRESHFVTPRMRNRRDFQHQLGAVAEANVEN